MPKENFSAPLFATIKALMAASSKTRLLLLQQMQSQLQTADLPMSLAELNNIVERLSFLMEQGQLDADGLDGKDLSGFVLDRYYCNISRTIAIVFDPSERAYNLVILNGAKFYDSSNDTTLKYPKAKQNHFIGSGTNKSVKKALCIKFEDQQFKVNVIARASEEILKFSIDKDSAFGNKLLLLDSVREKLFKVGTFTEINNALLELCEQAPQLKPRLLSFFSRVSQIEISKKLYGLGNLSTSVYVRPCIKQQSSSNNCKYKLKLYSFDQFAQHGTLHNINSNAQQKIGCIVTNSSEDMLLPAKLEAIIDDLAKALQKMHNNGIVHADLKAANILLEQSLTARIIDYGAGIDVANIKSNTKKILTMLGYTKIGDGTIEGYLIESKTLLFALTIIEQQMGLGRFKVDIDNTVPTFEGLNAKLKTVRDDIRIQAATSVTTYDNASPEIYSLHKDIYYKGLMWKPIALGRRVVEHVGDVEIEMSQKIDVRNDAWAFGITILTIICQFYNKGSSHYFPMAMAEYNPALKALLEPDIDKRATIDKFIELRKQHPIIKIPKKELEDVLHSKYVIAMVGLERKLRNIMVLRGELNNFKITDFNNIVEYMSWIENKMQQASLFSDDKKAELFFYHILFILSLIENPLQEIEQQFFKLLEFVHPGLNYTQTEMLADMVNTKFYPQTPVAQLINSKLASFCNADDVRDDGVFVSHKSKRLAVSG